MDIAQRTLHAHRYFVRETPGASALSWLLRGLGDVARCPLPSVMHGLMFAGAMVALVWLARAPVLVLAVALVVVAFVLPPFLLGLFQISRLLEQGEWPALTDAIHVWRRRDPRLVHWGVLLSGLALVWLAVLMMLAWVLGATAGGATGVPTSGVRGVMQGVAGGKLAVLSYSVLWAWTALCAALAFASGLVGLPMMLDSRASVGQAVATSWRTLKAAPAAVSLSAAAAAGLTLAAGASLMWGWLLAAPWLAHTSWHAYRDLVENETGIQDTAPVERMWGVGRH